MGTALVLRVLSFLCVATPGSPRSVAVATDHGDTFFCVELSLAEPPNPAFLAPTSAVYQGIQGPASQVYFLPFGDAGLVKSAELDAPDMDLWSPPTIEPVWHPLLVGKVRGAGTVTVPLDAVLWTETAPVSFALPDPDTVPAVEQAPSWMRAWAVAALAEARGPAREEDYGAYLERAFRRRFQVKSLPSSDFLSVMRQQEPPPSVYDLFTGGAALRESVQFDRVLQTVLGDTADIPLSSLQPLALEDHPFVEMRGGREFVASDLARLCPSDALYVRVRSLEEWFHLEDLLDRWGGSFLNAVHVGGQDRGVSQRYRRQLGLDHEALGRLLGSPVVGELAMIATDPLLPEGAGLAVVFSAKAGQELAFQALFDAQRRLLAAAPHRTVESRDQDGVAVDWCHDATGSVSSHHAVLDGRQVFSNSAALLAKIVGAAQGMVPSLYAAPDFQYYRALYPWDEGESAFLFLSQDWFRKITGPGWRIAHGRRRVAAEVMQDARFAWQSTAGPDRGLSLAELGERQWVDPAAAAALGVELDPAMGRVSTPGYGALACLRPVDELIPDRVSDGERLLYDSFREDYEHYWRQYLDPVGIQIRRTDARLEVDTLILPLIENSIYGMLQMFSGDPSGAPAHAPPLPPSALGALTLRWSPAEAGLGDLLHELASGQFRRDVAFDAAWLGRTVTLGAADGDLMFTGAADAALGLFGWFGGVRGAFSLAATAFLSALTLPTFAALEVRDAASLERFLDSLWHQASSSPRSWDDFQVESYTTGGESPIHTVTFTFFMIQMRIHYAFEGPWLLVTTRPGLLEEWRKELATHAPADYPHNGSLTIRPPAFQRAAPTVGILWQERIAGACLQNLAPLERAREAGRFEQAGEFLGYRAVCPEGGVYEVVEDSVRCRLHGDAQHRLQPLTPPENAAAVQLIRSLRDLTVDFSFTGDGLRSHLGATFEER